LNIGSNNENGLCIRGMVNALRFRYLGPGTYMGTGIISGKTNTCSKK
jgi:hypothetical protein